MGYNIMKYNTKDVNIFFTSDTHFSHKNIVRGVTNWGGDIENTTRDFNSISQHDNCLIDGINNLVGQNDYLFHMGDWSFGDFSNIELFRNRIACKNIHLILGNHDKHIRGNRDNVRKLFSSVNKANDIMIDGELFVLSHYSHRVWENSHRGSYHLYGHSHSALERLPHGRSMDVGVDNAFKLLGEYRPFTVNEVKTLLKNREQIIDHHL